MLAQYVTNTPETIRTVALGHGSHVILAREHNDQLHLSDASTLPYLPSVKSNDLEQHDYQIPSQYGISESVYSETYGVFLKFF